MPSTDQVLALIRAKVDHPASLRELLQVLGVPRDERTTFRRVLKTLVANGDLIQTRGKRYGLPEKMDLVVGHVQMHPDGFGFVVPERPLDEVAGDIYVAGANLNAAMHGDRVVARIERYKEGHRAEGRIVRLLGRGQRTLVGRYDVDRESGLQFVIPFDRRLIMDVHVPGGEAREARPGQIVVVELTRFPTATRNPVGRVVEVLGELDTPGVDVQVIMRKHGIPDQPSEEAVNEARRLGQHVRDADLVGRTDFRDWIAVTIDGEDARDFDDAVSIERLPSGHYWLGVHIADVAHYVARGSVLDTEAGERGTSVYFPERAVHMFPAELATGLCSLHPLVNRLVQSCLMEIGSDGTVVRYELHPGVIRSRARMTYTAVNAILEDRDPAVMAQYGELVPTFELMRELFEILNRRRRRRGSIDFDLPASEVVLDQAGLVEAIVAAERNVAHRIIEEFMLVANETVATHLDQQGLPALYRVHEDPDPLKVAQFEEFIEGLGYSLAAPPDGLRPEHFQRLTNRIRGTPEEKAVAYLMLRTMQRARYDAANLGHFGLALSSYTHFTSPIRRYPDLVVHRALNQWRGGLLDDRQRAELAEALPRVARHASDMERRADEAERELVQWKKVRFMASKVGDQFEGYVTGVAPFGLFVELIEHFVEGLVHISSMADDYYRYYDRAHILRGENTERVYRLGDAVVVQVLRVDLERRQIDLGLVEILEAVRVSERKRGPRRSRFRPRADRRGAGRPRRRRS